MQNTEDLCDTFSITQIENEILNLYPKIECLKEPKSKAEQHSKEWNTIYEQICFWTILLAEKNHPSKDTSRYEEEISNCVRLCLDSYNAEHGNLIHYITTSIHRTLNKAIKKDIDLGKKLTKTQKNAVLQNQSSRPFEKGLQVWEQIFKEQQERTKQYDSALITAYLLKTFSKMLSENFTVGDIDNLLYRRNFTDKEMLEQFIATEKFPSQQQTADSFGRDKTDASREMRKLKKKYKQNMGV